MLERYWVWEYGLFKKNPKRVDSLNPETTLEVVKYADAQATIADLQGQVEAAQTCIPKSVKLAIAADGDGLHETLVKLVTNFEQLQQRVAQLEGERDDALHAAQGMSNDLTALGQKYEAELATLQADHARVLAAIDEGLSASDTELAIKSIEELYEAHARVLGLVQALLETWVNGRKVCDGIPLTLRQQVESSLPAQPAQGGA
jgi:predicted  nucleic acid-binding Zn-ribbon protein